MTVASVSGPRLATFLRIVDSLANQYFQPNRSATSAWKARSFGMNTVTGPKSGSSRPATTSGGNASAATPTPAARMSKSYQLRSGPSPWAASRPAIVGSSSSAGCGRGGDRDAAGEGQGHCGGCELADLHVRVSWVRWRRRTLGGCCGGVRIGALIRMHDNEDSSSSASRHRRCEPAATASIAFGHAADVPTRGRRVPLQDHRFPRHQPARRLDRNRGALRRRASRVPGCVAQDVAGQQPARPQLAGRVRRRRADPHRAGDPQRGVRQARRADGRRERRLLDRHGRQHDPGVGHRRAEGALHPADPRRRRRVVPGLQRARRRSPTSPTSAAGPSSMATSGSSTARRSGPRPARPPT